MFRLAAAVLTTVLVASCATSAPVAVPSATAPAGVDLAAIGA
ncbi:hypothetical protein [Actinosynnema sp. NPDC020468]